MQKIVQKIKDLFHNVHSKNGAYSVGMIAIVIGIVIVCNLIIGRLPQSVRSIDISNDKIYEISDTSRKMLKKLDAKITFTIVAESDNVDERIRQFVERYAALSKNISVKSVDPVKHPSALQKYDTEGNAIVITNEDTKKSTSVSFTDIITYDEEAYYTYGTQQEKEFDGEGQLTSAINQVTNETKKTIYSTTGHGENTVSVSVSDMMEKANYTVTELNLLMDGTVPDDCDLLLMNAPTSDISQEEKDALSKYLKNGGKAMILLGETKDDASNLEALLKEYGLQKADGYIADMERCYQGNYYYIFPEITASGQLASGLSNNMVLLTNSFGLEQIEPARDSITVSSFMSTSKQGYAVTEEEQKQGTYIVGAVAEESLSSEEDSEEEKSRLTVIGSESIIDANITDSFSTVENLTLFMNAVNANFEDVKSVTIQPKSLEVTYNTVQYIGLFSILVIFGIPILVLIIGFSVWWKRRKA